MKRDGTVVAWGDNDWGQATVPVGLSDVIAISASGMYSLALKRDGTVAAWGSNSMSVTTPPSGLSDVTAISASGYHAMALVMQRPDLAVTIVDSPDPGTLGETVTYSMLVTNNGSADATGVRLTSVLPEGLTLVSVEATQGTCTGAGTVVCDLGTLATDASVTVKIAIKPPVAGTYSLNTSVTGIEADLNSDNNTTSEGTTVATRSQLNQLNVAIQGQGSVVSSPAAINCHPDCISYFVPGTTVTLSTTPADGWQVVGWEGACTGTATTCDVSVSTDLRVRARLTWLPGR